MSQLLTLHLATDHAGFALKEGVKVWLLEKGYEVIDHGAAVHDAEDDFPDFISKAAKAVSQNPCGARALLFGGSGQGEAMCANRFPHVRATVFYGGNEEIVILSRQHNDANVLSLGARFLSLDVTKQVIQLWLHEAFSDDEKYARRNQKIEHITKTLS